MTEFLVQPAGVRLTWSLVHFLWQGAAIAALLVIVLRRMSSLKPRGRYMLSMTALGLMAICPLATWFVLGEMELPTVTRWSLAAADALEVDSTFAANVPATLAGESGVTFQQFVPTLQPYLLFAWLMGVLLLGGRLVSGYLGTLWLKSGRMAVSLDLARRAMEIGRRLGVNATGRVFGCSRVPEAVAVGFWKPIVLVPVCWLTELPPNVLEAVIAHELAHIRRWDLWATLAQRVIETLLFYHPAVWWLSRRVSLEREMCCDELAVLATGRPVVYAQVLEYLGGRAAAVTSLALATSFKGERDMNLLTRVQHVLGMRTKPEAGRVWLAGVLSLAVLIGIFAISVGQFNQSAVADEEPAAARREGDRKEGDRRDSDRDTPKREAGARRPAEGDRKPAEGEGRRSAEGDRKAEPSGIDGFKPQNDREEVLYQMILQLRKETAALRQQLNQVRGGTREGAAKDVIRRDGDKSERPVARDSDAPPRRDGDRKPTGPRDGEKKETGPRDGDQRKDTGPRDGERKETGPRDGDDRKPAARDGEGDKPKARDGEGDRPKARDGEGDKPRDRDRDSE